MGLKLEEMLLSWDSASLVRAMSMIVFSWHQINRKEAVMADEIRPVYTPSITDKLTWLCEVGTALDAPCVVQPIALLIGKNSTILAPGKWNSYRGSITVVPGRTTPSLVARAYRVIIRDGNNLPRIRACRIWASGKPIPTRSVAIIRY